MTTANRSSQIRSNLGASRSFSPAADQINNQFQCLTTDLTELDEAEQLRLISAMQVQLAAQLSRLCGNR